jgi:excisionase family DNA binding protein
VTATAPVTVERAAAVLGVSASTVRRRIRDGTLRAESVSRPQGVVWLVHLPADATAGVNLPPPPAGAVGTAPVTASDAMIAYTRSLLEPLVAALERSQSRTAELERENGELTAHLTAAEDRLRMLETPNPQESPITRNLGPIEPDPPSEPPEPPSPAPIEPTSNGSGRAPWWRRWGGWF